MLGFVGVVIFGATLPVTHIGLEGFSPWFLTFARAVIATAAAATALTVMRRRLPRQSIGELFAAGMLLVFGFPGLATLAMQTVPASHGGVVLGILPLATAAFAALIGGERPSPSFWLFSILGAALVVIFALRDGGMTLVLGDLWLFGAGFCAALGYTLSGRLARRMPGWEVISWALVLTFPLSALGTALTAGSGILTPSASQWIALAYLGLGSMFGGFLFWNAGLAIGGIARVGQVQLLQTFVTLALSAALLGEEITGSMIGFAIAVAVVVWLGRKARISQTRP